MRCGQKLGARAGEIEGGGAAVWRRHGPGIWHGDYGHGLKLIAAVFCFGYYLIIVFGFLVSGKRAMGTGRADLVLRWDFVSCCFAGPPYIGRERRRKYLFLLQLTEEKSLKNHKNPYLNSFTSKPSTTETHITSPNLLQICRTHLFSSTHNHHDADDADLPTCRRRPQAQVAHLLRCCNSSTSVLFAAPPIQSPVPTHPSHLHRSQLATQSPLTSTLILISATNSSCSSTPTTTTTPTTPSLPFLPVAALCRAAPAQLYLHRRRRTHHPLPTSPASSMLSLPPSLI
ncbi:hypothetical protein M0R45_026173 [Rubus argutus]|uniref:Uncharacterized protein n=1 Tax=Rubus argutus TaxID=59490 RepID=A0AAW1WWU7_RUBAR